VLENFVGTPINDGFGRFSISGTSVVIYVEHVDGRGYTALHYAAEWTQTEKSCNVPGTPYKPKTTD
jgi:hypothetical protein